MILCYGRWSSTKRALLYQSGGLNVFVSWPVVKHKMCLVISVRWIEWLCVVAGGQVQNAPCHVGLNGFVSWPVVKHERHVRRTKMPPVVARRSKKSQLVTKLQRTGSSLYRMIPIACCIILPVDSRKVTVT